ncbi:rocF-arginase: arginase [Gaiella occulta]|uniref:Arginase n=1 Tax=Gaiella occulta TaxID=1002870 RepID=A0A7M2YWL4_9ACTN|nr:arginase [Gaiella occulta]RDI74120.1 rocF-arginase: arginase [Gaiella occulta]
MSSEHAKAVSIIGAPLDLGQTRRGVDMGPSAIRYAGLEERLAEIGYAVTERGNVAAPEPEALTVRDARARYLPEILDACAALAALVEGAVREGARPLVLGGDHAIALGTLAGLAAAAGQPGGVIWIDAHGDLNTPETSPSGNVHGMPLAAALGRAPEWFRHDGLALPAVTPSRVALVGIRSLDPAERAYLRDADIRVFTMSDIDRIGIERAVREALDHVAGPGFVHASLDLDSLDPEVAPGVGTPVRGGLTYREAHLACELIAESELLGSLEVVEANPILDRENTTALTAVELVASALGKTIL